MTGELTHENFMQMAMLPAQQRDRLQQSMDIIERITWREQLVGENAVNALYDIRKEVKRLSYVPEVPNTLLMDRLPETWFNGSSDHLYELEIPDGLEDELKERLKSFQDKCLGFGHGFEKPSPTEEDVKWAIKEAKELLMEIDKTLKVEVIKGSYE